MNTSHRRTTTKKLMCVVLPLVVAMLAFALQGAAQDQNTDPPGRVARLGYMEGSVSFQPAGETDWVEAVQNRPMTIGDKIWADKDSRAELQLGTAVIRLSANTGVSFLNLDDQTVQLQLSSGEINVRVRNLNSNDDFEIDTPNLAFTVSQPGSYRLQASEDGANTVVAVRDGDGQATGNGQTYTLHAGQMGTFSGTDSLNADVEQTGQPDQFDTWADGRERRYADSRSAQYVSRGVVGFDDLDSYGDWRDDPSYGHVWYPNQVSAGWAPYRQGHWDWIDPWGYTWVDDSPWGYAPFHYGRWASINGRWGWIAGPPSEPPVYAPALVAFVGGGPGDFGGNVGWFPLGPREVYVPSYPVSQGYMTRVNVSNTTVNRTTVTNVYNTTVVNKTTINNVTYVNQKVQGAVTVVPQRAFASAQPVARNTVAVNQRELAAARVTPRAAVNPTRESVLGAKANTANHVTAPPPAVANRTVIAKKTPPPPPPPFAARQKAMSAHPGEPLPRRELASLHPPAAVHPAVRVAPPGKPATPAAHPGNQPKAEPPEANRPGAAPPNAHPEANKPPEPNRPPAAQPNERPAPNRPEAAPRNERPDGKAQPNNRPEANRPPESNRPPTAQPNERPAPNRPEAAPRNDRPDGNAQPNNRPEANRPPESNRPPAAQPNERPAPNRPEAAPRNERPEGNPQPNNRPDARTNNRPDANPREANPPNRSESPRPGTQPAQPPDRNNRSAQPADRPSERRTPSASSPDKQTDQSKTPAQKKEEQQKSQDEQKPHSE